MVFKELGRPQVTLMLLLLKLSTLNKLKTKRTKLESLEKFRETEVLFMTHQYGLITIRVNNL